MVTKIELEKFFETKYPWVENHIRETKGDCAFDRFLDAFMDYLELEKDDFGNIIYPECKSCDLFKEGLCTEYCPAIIEKYR